MGHFTAPTESAYASGGTIYRDQSPTYAHYNYLKPGIIPWLKRRRFESALRLAEDFFDRATVAMDVGCADGVLLPSLARRFRTVYGIDTDSDHLAVAARATAHLANVALVEGVQDHLRNRADVVFCLETLEHVRDRTAFVHTLFTLLRPRGAVIVSVPRTVGWEFMAKYMVQAALRMPHEYLTMREIVRAGILSDTSALEPRWNGGHLGFNHRLLERELRRHYRIARTAWLPWSALYRIEH